MSTTQTTNNNSVSFDDIKELFKQTSREFQEIKEMFKETDRRSQETDRRFQETDRRFQETDRKFQETDRKFQETDRKIQETALQIKETDKQIKETNKKIAELGDRIGQIIEAMVEGNIVQKFNDLDYSFNRYMPHVEFINKELGICGEIDFMLENCDTALLVEVKTHLTIPDVKDHIKRLEKYRLYQDATGRPCKLLAAAAGGVISQNVCDYVLKQGLFLIRQSGESVTILTPPKGIKLRTW
ncbi:MAG: hypothetical protein LBU34_18110 [Planctomycetaceae bacterium]|nr:hypothetical protein [Planctomycetaceae bacterium]